MRRLALALACVGLLSPAHAQDLASLDVPVSRAPPRYIAEPNNVCFAEARLHRWCRVFISTGPSSCACGSAARGNMVFGTLITDSQLIELIGEYRYKQTNVGANSEAYARGARNGGTRSAGF